MNVRIERGSDGRMNLRKDGRAGATGRKKLVAVGLAVAFLAVALTGIQTALAEGDKNQLTHGEDEGYYDVNNWNPYEDSDFPGDDLQNRTGV